MKIPRKRVEAWLEALEKARKVGENLAKSLGRVTVILHGSYARGDFNLWSDIDLLVVSDAFRGVRVLDRYDVVSELLEPGVEAVLLTPQEFEELVKKPSWRHALARGAVMVRDDYGFADVVRRIAGSRLVSYSDMLRKVKRLLRESIEL